MLGAGSFWVPVATPSLISFWWQFLDISLSITVLLVRILHIPKNTLSNASLTSCFRISFSLFETWNNAMNPVQENGITQTLIVVFSRDNVTL